MIKLLLHVTLLLIGVSVVGIIAARLIGEQRPRDWLAFISAQDNLLTAFVFDVSLNRELNISTLLRHTQPGCEHNSPSWSRDGRLALVEYCPSGSHIRILDFYTGTTSYLNEQIVGGFRPSWSPDGRITFFAQQDNIYRLYIGDPLTGSVTAIDDTTNNLLVALWSNDGKLAFLTGMSNDVLDSALYVRYVSGQVRPSGTKMNRPMLAWSPDSTRLAYAWFSYKDQQLDLALVDLATGQSTQLTNTPYPVSEYNPVWLPDGRLAFNRNEGGYTTFYVLDLTSGTEVNVLANQNEVIDAIWAPNGQHLAVVLPDASLGVVEVNTGTLTRIHESSTGALPVWAK